MNQSGLWFAHKLTTVYMLTPAKSTVDADDTSVAAAATPAPPSAPPLSEAAERAKAVFAAVDKDASGYVDKEELRAHVVGHLVSSVIIPPPPSAAATRAPAPTPLLAHVPPHSLRIHSGASSISCSR